MLCLLSNPAFVKLTQTRQFGPYKNEPTKNRNYSTIQVILVHKNPPSRFVLTAFSHNWFFFKCSLILSPSSLTLINAVSLKWCWRQCHHPQPMVKMTLLPLIDAIGSLTNISGPDWWLGLGYGTARCHHQQGKPISLPVPLPPSPTTPTPPPRPQGTHLFTTSPQALPLLSLSFLPLPPLPLHCSVHLKSAWYVLVPYRTNRRLVQPYCSMSFSCHQNACFSMSHDLVIYFSTFFFFKLYLLIYELIYLLICELIIIRLIEISYRSLVGLGIHEISVVSSSRTKWLCLLLNFWETFKAFELYFLGIFDFRYHM